MKFIYTSIGLFTALSLTAQNNVGIGTLNPNPQAILDIESSDKGVLISRLTTTARNTLGTALTNAEDGMLVYDKDLTTFFYWDGPNLQWVQVGSGTGDNWGTQVVQTAGTNISGDGTTANPLTVTDNDNDPNNEIELPATANNGEVLTWDGTNWVPQTPPSGADNWGTDIVNTSGTNISGDGTTGNPITITEVDGDVTNEIQDLSLNTTTHILTITNNGTATNIDLSPYLDNTDAQTLSLTGNTLAISNGNNVTLTDNIDDADSDPANEYNVGVSLTGDNLNIIDGGGTLTVDISSLKDHDWYEVGGTTHPDNINDNIYTQGNVGVGIVAPTHRLHVLTGDVFVDMTSGLGYGSLGSGGLELYRDPTGTVPEVNGFVDFKDNGTDDSDFRIFYNNSIGTNGALVFSASTTGTPNTTPEMLIRNQDGFVGIGTANPTQKLQVEQGSLLMNGNAAQIYLKADVASTDPGDIVFVNGDGTNKARIWSDPGNNEGLQLNGIGDATVHMKIIQNGNVGVNIGAPTAKLDINGDLKVRTLTVGNSTEEVLVVDGTGLVKKVAALVPPGMINAFAGTTAPAGYLMCDGSAVSRVTYADLFAVIGTTYGVGNGTTTFNVPDLRGEFIRGFDAGRGADPTRTLGSNQIASPVVGDDNNAPNNYSMQVNGYSPQYFDNYDPAYSGIYFYYSSSAPYTITPSNGGGFLRGSRPRNVAMNYCVKF